MKILWLDDEIEFLQPHIMFLESEGLKVIGVDHPLKALELAKLEAFDVILVDYKMPQISGIEFAREIKKMHPNIPLVLITMVQDKEVMDEALSIDVFDYLVKPVHPSQIMAVLKKLERDKLKDRSETRRILDYYNMLNSLGNKWKDWLEKGSILFNWMVESPEDDLLKEERKSKSLEYATWIIENMPSLLADDEVPWIFKVFKNEIIPLLQNSERVTVLVFDNFRYDQALDLSQTIPSSYRLEIKPIFSVIPTATQFARNSFFSGHTPFDTDRRNQGWLRDNLHEKELLEQNLVENSIRNLSLFVKKINTLDALKQESFQHGAKLEVYVINFFDMIFHLREEESPLRGLIKNAEDYLNLCKFILETSKFLEKLNVRHIFITTDHGWVKGEKAVVIQGGAEATEGLRFKFGDSLKAIEGKPIELSDLKSYGIPQISRHLFLAKGYDYFVYRSDPGKYKRKYKGGLYHGGVSIEEMIIPLIKLRKG